jgi:hypothetical protein
MLDDIILLLPGVISLLLRAGRGSAACLLVVYWAAMLNNFLVVYLKTSFGARNGGGCSASRTTLLDALGPSPLGSQQCPFRSLCPPWRGFHTWLFGLCGHVHLASLMASLGFGALAQLPWWALG